MSVQKGLCRCPGRSHQVKGGRALHLSKCERDHFVFNVCGYTAGEFVVREPGFVG